MEISVKHGQEMVIRFNGRLDTVSSLELSKRLEEEVINENLVIFDMKDTEYISSAGLRLIYSLKKDLSNKNKELEIHNMNNACKEVFKVTGFDKLITIK